MTNTDGDPITVADPDNANPTRIYQSEKGLHNHSPVWSTDGQWIYFIHGTPDADRMSIWRVRPTGTRARTVDRPRVCHVARAARPAHGVVHGARFVGRRPVAVGADTDTRTSRRVSPGPEQSTSIGASVDGRRLVASVARPRAELLTIPIMARLTTVADVQPYGVPGVRALAPRIRGPALFYLSGQGTGDGLWRRQDNQATEIGAALAAPSSSRRRSLPTGFWSPSCCDGR